VTAVLRLGTRGSALALAQATGVAADLTALTGRQVELVQISTKGDTSSEPLDQIGGTGVFVSALREALLDGRIDLAVHSLKDLPTADAPGLVIAAVPPREDPRDALITRDGLMLGELRPGAKLGTGSPNTINPLLDTWWKKLSARLDAGPAALHRLPESVAHVAEALWMQALDEGRRRAAQEQHSTTRALATDKQHLEVRSHVLSLREGEGELESRLHDREHRQAALEAQVQDLTVLLKKEQATRDAQTRRIAALEQELLAASSRARKQPRPKAQRQANAQPPRHRPKRAKKSSPPAKTKTRKTPARRKAKPRRPR